MSATTNDTGLDGVYDQNNIFAKILRGEIPCVKVYEDDVVLSLMDLFPQSPGHTLVIPKTPARNFLEVPPQLVGPYLERVQKIARAVKAAMKPDGILVTHFNGAVAGQSVFHAHFHIIPRWEDGAMADHAHGKMAGKTELETHAARIAAAL
jgi:histidine triad (HIT) family protein